MDDEEFDVDELEGAEYEESKRYHGPQPPKDTILSGNVKRAWWSETKKGDRMMVALFEATDGKYKGLGVFDRITFNTASKWRWKPFIDATGLTLNDIKKKNFISSDDDNMGAPIIHIGSWYPGEDSADARIITGRSKDNNDEWRTEVAEWLSFEDEEEEDEAEEEQPARPTRGRAAKSAATSKAGAARRRPEPEPVDDEDDDELSEEEAEELEEDEEEQPRRTAAKRRTAA